MGVDIARAFKAPFEDPEWVKKTLLGWVWFMLIVTIPAVYGAVIEYVGSVARGDERLPEWNDFGGKWVKGFLAGVAAFIYFLPVVVIGALLVVPVAISAQTDANGTHWPAGRWHVPVLDRRGHLHDRGLRPLLRRARELCDQGPLRGVLRGRRDHRQGQGARLLDGVAVRDRRVDRGFRGDEHPHRDVHRRNPRGRGRVPRVHDDRAPVRPVGSRRL